MVLPRRQLGAGWVSLPTVAAHEHTTWQHVACRHSTQQVLHLLYTWHPMQLETRQYLPDQLQTGDVTDGSVAGAPAAVQQQPPVVRYAANHGFVQCMSAHV
jgi:hypothetical protein